MTTPDMERKYLSIDYQNGAKSVTQLVYQWNSASFQCRVERWKFKADLINTRCWEDQPPFVQAAITARDKTLYSIRLEDKQ